MKKKQKKHPLALTIAVLLHGPRCVVAEPAPVVPPDIDAPQPAHKADKGTAGRKVERPIREAVPASHDTSLAGGASAGGSPDTAVDAPVELDPIEVIAERVEGGFKADMQSTATKMPLSIRETPQSISVITQDSIKARQAISLGQALETAAGVTQANEPGPFAGRSGFPFTTYQIRGIETPLLFGVLEDGFLNPQTTGARDLALYERVEVVKGPSSTLYGRGPASGFINLVRKKPLPEFRTGLDVTIGSFDFYRVDGDVTGPLLKSGKARGRLVFAHEDAGSFVDFAESERQVVGTSLEFDLSDSTRLLLHGTYQHDRFIPHLGLPLQSDGENFKAPDVRRSLFFGVPGEDRSTRELVTGSVQLEQEIGDRWLATLRLNANSPRVSQDNGLHASSLTPSGDTQLYAFPYESDGDIYSGEIRLNGQVEAFGRSANLTLGVDRTDLNYNFGVRYDAPVGIANIYAENFDDFAFVEPTMGFSDSPFGEFESNGVYGQVQFRAVDRLSILLGGRYDWVDASEDGFGPEPKRDEAFTGRAGLTFDLSKQISVYGLYAESFQPVSKAGRDGILDPETGDIYEIGLKTEWLDGRLGANAALFRIERDKVPIRDPANGPFEFFNVNAGLLRADGFELEINGEPLPGWNLSFGGILLDSEFIERDDPNFGNSPTDAADWQVGFYTSYELQTGPLQGLGAGVGLFAVDDRPVSESLKGTISGYERVDLQAFYNGFKPLRVSLQVRNVLDEKYIESLFDECSANHFGAPIAALLTVRYEFGD
ncbi:MAG: TonB-dependent siderophore receptor [Gammaproteobacteria bacterium]